MFRPSFAMLLADYVRWTGDLGPTRALWPAAQATVGWIRKRVRRDGWLTYARRSPIGLANQGWKDSRDAVLHADGRLARPPIPLAEVQGYAYAAYRAAAELSARLGDGPAAARLAADADALRTAFNREFWMEAEEFCTLALDGDGRWCEVISSNPGHCLWTGIVDERRVTVVAALFDAARWFEHGRVPELFCGFPRVPDHGPTAYPVACAPQAWAAGAPLQWLAALAGFEADAVIVRR